MVAPEDYKTVGVVKAPGRLSDAQFSKDRDAYQRLRKQGLQPPHIDGCAQLEKEAVTRDEIVTGVVRPDISAAERKKAASERRAAFDRAREL
jgi:hypothetical protein